MISADDLGAVPSACIDGNWQRGNGPAIDIINPSTEDRILALAAVDAAQLDQAVAAAKRALPGWRETHPAERGAVLRRVATLVEQHRPRLEALQQLNSGKPALEASIDVGDVIATFNHYADRCESGEGLLPAAVKLPDQAYSAELQRVASGVAGLIVPWNFPMVTTSWKIAPALAAGVTVVLKPSEVTPLAEIALFEILHEAGLPAGVANLVYGAGPVGAGIVAHRGISKISFTGSNATGQRIMQAAAERLQRVTLELGGKSALIVLDDADLKTAVDLAIPGAFFNAGQMCSATSRVLVASRLYGEFVERLAAAAKALHAAGPDDERGTIGPLVNRAQHDKVKGYIERGVAEGSKLASGGGRPKNLGDKGFFLEPTVFTDLADGSPLWREEIFGPVVCVRPFDGDAAGVAAANDSDFGLVATVVSGDAAHGKKIADQLEVGVVWVNAPQVIFPETSWGGFKLSGVGRELGPWGLQSFQEIKHVVTARQ